MAENGVAGVVVKALGAIVMLVALTARVFPEDGWRIGPADGWVKEIPAGTEVSASSGEDVTGVNYLLIDRQYRINAADPSAYFHYAVRVENRSGISESSQLSITFDPSYQTLTLHQILVHRAGTTSSRLKPEAVSILRREHGLDYQILDGSRTAHIVLDDIRVGDIIEYSYAISGSNPVFAGRTSTLR